MKPEFIDVHAHLNFAAFDADRKEVIERALAANVWMVNVGTQKDTSWKALEIAEEYSQGVFAIVGLHPVHTGQSFHDQKELGEGGKEFVSRGEQFDPKSYRDMLKSKKVLAIGECGLDYYRLDPASIEKQRSAFEMQIALAKESGKPLMLHIRSHPKDGARENQSAYRDAYEILKDKGLTGNVHFFAGSYEEAKLFLDIGFTLSFTGVITFARDYDEVIKKIPLSSILSETDCPYITPLPYRGKRNEPLYVREVVKKIAEIRGEDLEKVKTTLVENALRVFQMNYTK